MITTANWIESERRQRERRGQERTHRLDGGAADLESILRRFVRVSRDVEGRSSRMELPDAAGERILRRWRAAVIAACEETNATNP